MTVNTFQSWFLTKCLAALKQYFLINIGNISYKFKVICYHLSHLTIVFTYFDLGYVYLSRVRNIAYHIMWWKFRDLHWKEGYLHGTDHHDADILTAKELSWILLENLQWLGPWLTEPRLFSSLHPFLFTQYSYTTFVLMNFCGHLLIFTLQFVIDTPFFFETSPSTLFMVECA